MSELQIGLLSIAVVVVVAVYLYGYVQQRQYRSQLGDTFSSAREDALYQTNSPIEAAIEISESVSDLIDEEVAALETPSVETTHTSPVEFDLIDPLTDYIVLMQLPHPMTSDALAPLWGRRFDFGKRVNACGLNDTTGRWDRLIAESQQTYREFRIGLLLADRSGPVSAARLTDFYTVLRDASDELQADSVLPSVEEALQQAKKLDEFCAQVDQMIGLNILPHVGRLLFGSEVSHVAERHGFKLQADGSFHLLDAQGLTLFNLGSMDGSAFQFHTLSQTRVQGLTLLLDVPRVDHPAQRFDEMANLAQQLGLGLRAELVDDNRHELNAAALAQIREQVIDIENRMTEGKIIPGSPQALRLFS
jgi:FtsZ-interacting cell division protein ZipA